MKPRVLLVVALVAGGILWFVMTRNSDERAIRRNLATLATVLSSTGDPAKDPAPIARLATMRKLLAEDCRVVPGEAYPAVEGRDNLIGTMAQAVRSIERLTVSFHDVSVEVVGERATTVQTAKAVSARPGNEEILDVREVRVTWRKVDGKWRVAVVEEVATLR